MAGNSSLLEMCLQEAQLGQYSQSFQDAGILDLESLANLTMQEYSNFGVTPTEDKKQLFRLIHTLRTLDLNKLSDIDDRKLHTQGKSRVMEDKNNIRAANKENRNHQSTRTSTTSYEHSVTESADYTNDNKVKLIDTKRNNALNRTFDKDDEESCQNENTECIESHDLVNNNQAVVNHTAKDDNTDDSNVHIQIFEHTHAGYNYGVPSASPATPQRPKSGMKLATSLGSAMSFSRRGPPVEDERIRVCVRKRPLNQKEWKAGEGEAVSVEGRSTVLVKERKLAVDLTKVLQVHKYHFDEVFSESCSNEDVYERTAKPLINTIFKKGQATCFAYGQTGAGKTHTLLGAEGGVKGLYLLAAQDIFTILRSSPDASGLVVCVSYFEIYCGQLFDLLNNRERLHARENAHHKVCISGLNEVQVSGPQALMQVVENGNKVRIIGVSGVNSDSSRSHAILQMQLKDKAGNQIGKFSFIDLAGSERACDMVEPDKVTRLEGAEINTSLLALKECIRALDQEKRHTPFRQSKLTQVLRDSFLGQSRTCMIACVAPNASAVEHTLNTLRYADRVKELRQEGALNTSLPSTPNATKTSTLQHPPTPSDFSPFSTSTPMKANQSKRDVESPMQKLSSKKRIDSRSKQGSVQNKWTETRRKSAPDTSPSAATKNSSVPGGGNKVVRKSSSYQNLKGGDPQSERKDMRKKRSNSSKDTVQRVKVNQTSGLNKSVPSDKKNGVRSRPGVLDTKDSYSKTVESDVSKKSTRDVPSRSLHDTTPSKRTPEVKARMKRAFLNTSLPVWEPDPPPDKPVTPQKLPLPRVLEFENPRFVESPTKERPDDGKGKDRLQDEPDPPVHYRLDVPNPKFIDNQQQRLDGDESGYVPDVDSEIQTPRTRQAVQTKSEKKTKVKHTKQDGNSKDVASLKKADGNRERTSSSESGQLWGNDSNSTTELLAEIERSLQRSPVPLSPRPGSEPWMLVAANDRYQGTVKDEDLGSMPSPNVRKELFVNVEHMSDIPGAEVAEDSIRKTLSPSLRGGDSDMSVKQRKVSQSLKAKLSNENLEMLPSPKSPRDVKGTWSTESRDRGDETSQTQQRSLHLVKEKLQHSGFVQDSHSHGLSSAEISRIYVGSIGERRDWTDCASHQSPSKPHDTPSQQTRELSHRPGPVGQQSLEASAPTSSQSAASYHRTLQIDVTPEGSVYTTQAGSGVRQFSAATSTPKAFRHESLGRESSLLQLSFSTIQSPIKQEKLPTQPIQIIHNTQEEEDDIEEVYLPVSPPPTLRKSKTEGDLRATLHGVLQKGRQQLDTSSDIGGTLRPPERPTYQRQNSAAERASTLSSQSSKTTAQSYNNTRDLVLAAHAEQLEETLKLCETGWALIGQLRNGEMDLVSYIAEASQLLDSHVWCIDTFRDQLNSFSRCSSPNK